MSFMIANAKEFAETTLKCVSGSVPKSIKGNYFRNGPGILNYDDVVINHWFSSAGCILKIHLENGECKAQLKFADTPLHRRREVQKSFNLSWFSTLWSKWKNGDQHTNPANTSVLPLKNSPHFLALCEGGQPFIMNKTDLSSNNFSNYDWISSSFSAHPKVDPTNGDIFNIGMDNSNLRLMRATQEMKKIVESSIKLRDVQSIHDFCLAGDYLVILEAPVQFHLKDLLTTNKFFYDCLSFDFDLPTLVHVFQKQSLKHLKTFDFDPFYCFHFTNGYSNKQKIVIEYIRYNPQSCKELFRAVSTLPQMTQPGFKDSFKGKSHLEQLTINLLDFKTNIKTTKINGQFPVCEEHEVGKEWRYTYAVGSEIEQISKFDTIYKYDRIKDMVEKVYLGEEVHVSEPALIRTEKDLYILSIVNRNKKSFVEIYDSNSLKSVCQLELPVFVPAGFHGKWDTIV